MYKYIFMYKIHIIILMIIHTYVHTYMFGIDLEPKSLIKYLKITNIDVFKN